MQTKYVFFSKSNDGGPAQRMLEIVASPLRWNGDASTMRKVLNHLAIQKMYLSNDADIDRLPEMFKSENLYCIKNPIDVIKATWADAMIPSGPRAPKDKDEQDKDRDEQNKKAGTEAEKESATEPEPLNEAGKEREKELEDLADKSKSPKDKRKI